MREAIELAEKHGYKASSYEKEGEPHVYASQIWLHDQFWIALGKALNWRFCRVHGQYSDSDLEMCHDRKHDQWYEEWHKFIDHLADRKSADSFFEELLVPSKERLK